MRPSVWPEGRDLLCLVQALLQAWTVTSECKQLVAAHVGHEQRCHGQAFLQGEQAKILAQNVQDNLGEQSDVGVVACIADIQMNYTPPNSDELG